MKRSDWYIRIAHSSNSLHLLVTMLLSRQILTRLGPSKSMLKSADPDPTHSEAATLLSIEVAPMLVEVVVAVSRRTLVAAISSNVVEGLAM